MNSGGRAAPLETLGIGLVTGFSAAHLLWMGGAVVCPRAPLGDTLSKQVETHVWICPLASLILLTTRCVVDRMEHSVASMLEYEKGNLSESFAE